MAGIAQRKAFWISCDLRNRAVKFLIKIIGGVETAFGIPFQ